MIRLPFDDIVPGSSDDDDTVERSDAEMEWRGVTPANAGPSSTNDESPDLGDLVARRVHSYLRAPDSPEFSGAFMDLDTAPRAAGPSKQKSLPISPSRMPPRVQPPPFKARPRGADFVSIDCSPHLIPSQDSSFDR
jgi:hypothetical protein